MTTDAPSFTFDSTRVEELRLYTEHLELLRAEDAKRTAMLAEMIDNIVNPKPVPAEDRREDKRDWFAGQVAGALLTASISEGIRDGYTLGGDVAENAYKMADALIKERDK